MSEALGKARTMQHPDVINDLDHPVETDPLSDLMADAQIIKDLIAGMSRTATQVEGLIGAVHEMKCSIEELADRFNADFDTLRGDIRTIPVMENRIKSLEETVKDLVLKVEKLREQAWFQRGLAAAIGAGASIAVTELGKLLGK